MADANETIADIIAEMRGMGNYQRYSGDHARVLANRLEAAHKREACDCAKLREAVAKCVNLITEFGNAEIVKTPLDVIVDIEAILKAALAAPPRNCDVGTPKEQIERWQAFCKRYDDDCKGCPCEAADTWNYTYCFAKWAQMPYKEGGNK